MSLPFHLSLPIAALALTLLGCLTKPEVTLETKCPPPPDGVLKYAAPLKKLPPNLDPKQMLDAWLDDTGQYLKLMEEHNTTIQWGVQNCGWPQPVILLPPGSTTASN